VILELQRTDMVEQSVPGDDDPEIPQEAGACFTPEGKADVPEPAVQTLGPASVWTARLGRGSAKIARAQNLSHRRRTFGGAGER
jgi:hypothetical protein